MFHSIPALAAFLTLAATTALAADKPKADPKGTPLELSITGKTLKFTLDTGGLTPAEYKQKIEDSPKPRGGRPPATPTVDLTLEIKNTSDKAVMVWSGGDSVVIELELKGKGAVTANPMLAFTREFRLPTAVEIAPGKSLSIPVKSLTSGFRGASKFTYWTAPGDYELVATFKTGMTPPPKDAKENDGFGEVTLTSSPLKLTVEEKK